MHVAPRGFPSRLGPCGALGRAPCVQWVLVVCCTRGGAYVSVPVSHPTLPLSGLVSMRLFSTSPSLFLV